MADFGSKGKVVIVTGGTGLVGKAIEEIVGQESKIEGETFIFLGNIEMNYNLHDHIHAYISIVCMYRDICI
jgi:FlaA1/EpsC-like NDP-sugar epimerase